MGPEIVLFICGGIWAYFGWKMVQQYHRRKGQTRAVRPRRNTPSNYVYSDGNQGIWIGGDKVSDVHPSKPTLDEQFMLAFYQAWIEPTQEIIALIDSECTPAEPEPEPEHACPPCGHGQVKNAEYVFRMEQKAQMQQERIFALEARLKEMVDYNIQQNLMYGSAIDTKRMFR